MAKFVSKFTGQEIDNGVEAVRTKIGAEYFDPATNTKFNFKDELDKAEWLSTGEPSLVLSETAYNFSGTQYQVKIISDMPKNLFFTTKEEKAEITVSFASQKKGITDVSWQDIVEDYSVSVYVDKGSTGTFTPLVVDQFVMSGKTFTFDVKKVLATGVNRVRVVAIGTESEGKAQGSEMFIVNLTSMYLSPSNFTWYKPFIEGETYSLGGMNIGGNLNKTLKVKMTKEGYEKLYEVAIGSDIYTTTAYVFKGLEFPEGGTGVYNVDIWLDANGLESEHLSYNIICVSQADKFTAQLVAIGDPAKTVYNFSDNKLFEYCVYNGGTATATPHIKIAYVVNTNPTTIINEDLVDVATAAPLTYTASLEIEMEDESAALQLETLMTYGNEQVIVFPVDNSKSYPATTGAVFYMNPSARNNAQSNREKVINSITGAELDATFIRMAWTDGADGWTTDENGRKCLKLPAGCPMELAYQPMASVSQKTIELVYKVKNAADYDEPIFTIGDVYFEDSIKEENDYNIERINDAYFSATSVGQSATLTSNTGMAYTKPVLLKAGEKIVMRRQSTCICQTDENASYYKALVISSNGSDNVEYTATEDTYVALSSTKASFGAFQPYVVRLVRIQGEFNPNFRGIVIRPKNILIHSRDLNVNDSLQDYNTTDEETLHVLITIIPNYKTNYGNLAQIYVNGDKVRSFSFETADRWDVAANMKFGSESADTYWYKARVYDRGFESYDALKNYINSLPSTKAKEDAKAKIEAPLDDSYKLSYDECVKNGLNTMVVEILDQDQTIPSIATPSAKQCNLWVKINNPIEGEMDADFARLFSGEIIEDQTIEGQGTTAMTYARWNFRWKLGSAYNKRRITAKKNFASSMHSHKMGATRLFNDLNRAIVGPNDADSRVAVYQYPVYGFQKIRIEGTEDYMYEPIGLYTIGPDKGDKKTFGFDGEYESTLIHLEGTDHTPKGVGFDYPYEELGYSGSAEALGAVNATGAVVAAWECGAAGEYDPKDEPTETKAMLDAQFKPAYDVVEKNTTYILGVTETLAEMNANISAWQARKDAEGRSYADLQFFTDGVYDLYFYNTRTQQYAPRGINMLTDLGVSVDGLSLDEKTELFKAKRRERFMANWETYWHKNDAIFHYAFVLIFGATDNFKKNTYPYKYKAIADSGVYRWRQDDLDTLFDINNQGLAAKIYSILVGDKTDTGSGSIYRGDTSAFWTLIKECFPTEIKAMVHAIFDKMVELSPYGNNTLEKLVGCIRYYFWDKAQAYFPASAYSKDAEWTYEDTWAAGLYKEVNPLQQSLGGHKEAEIDWVTMRMLFCAMYFNYGPFGAVNDSFSDTSTGQIAYGGAGAKTYVITMACDGNPTILRGQSELVTYGGRVKAGETIELTVPDSSGADTRIYIQGVDWTEDIGDLSDLQVSADNPQLSVASKRLQRLKVGDEDASKVTTNVQALNFGECPSMIVVDARNAKSLTGTIDLSKMPRLMEAYFGGTGVKAVNVPNGSKIAVLELGEETTQISLMNLKFMQSGKSQEFVPSFQKDSHYTTNQGVGATCPLSVSTTTGFYCCAFNCVGYNTITITGNGGNAARLWCFLDDNNKILSLAEANAVESELTLEIPEGAAKVVCNFNANANSNFSVVAKTASVKGFTYTSLPKLEFLRIENCSQLNPFTMLKSIYNTDGNVIRDIRIIGFDVDGDASDVTMIANLANDVDKDGNEHIYNGIDAEGKPMDNSHPIIEGRLRINGNIYEDDYKALKAVFSNLVMEFLGFYVSIKDPKVREILLAKITTDDGVGLTREDIEGVTSIGTWFNGNTEIETFDEFERFTGVKSLGSSNNNTSNAAFYNCTSLMSLGLPSSLTEIGYNAIRGCTLLTNIKGLENATIIRDNAFYGCAALDVEELNLPNLKTLGANAFYGVKVKKFILPALTSLPNASTSTEMFGSKEYLEEVDIHGITNIPLYNFYNYASLKKVILNWENLTTLGAYAFMNCASLKFEGLSLPNLTSLGTGVFDSCVLLEGDVVLPKVTTIGAQTFKKTAIKTLDAQSLTSIGDASGGNKTNGAFANCAELTSVMIPSATTLGHSAFYHCDKLESVSTDSLVTLGMGCFASCTSLKTSSFPNVETINSQAFMGAGPMEGFSAPKLKGTLSYYTFQTSAIKSIANLGSITELQDGINDRGVFFNCKSLEMVVLPNTLTKIGAYSFHGCSSLVECDIPKSVTYIGSAAFHGCSELAYDNLDLSNVTSFGSNVFYGVKIKTLNLSAVDSLPATNAGHSHFGDKGVLEKIILSEGLEVIPTYCFYKYKNLTDINLDKVKRLESYALDSIGISGDLVFDSLEYLGQGALGGTTSFTSINLPSVIELAYYALDNKTALKKVDIGPNCTTIGNFAFQSDTNLQEVIIRATTPPTLGSNALRWTNDNLIIYVPDASVDTYKEASGWSAFADRIYPLSVYEAGGLENVVQFADPAVEAICLANFNPDGNGIITKDEAAAVTSIGSTFRGNKEITSFDELKYFTGVTSLVADAFADATNIETISLPPNCTIIGSAAFWSCSKLATINGLEQVTSVGSQGFLAVKITSLSLPNYQGAIAERAFSYCSNLEVADLGAGVTQLSGEVFSSDTKLATLIVRATTPPTLVGTNFYQCPLSVIYVPDASVDAYKNASNWSAFASIIKPMSQYNG